MSLLDEKLYTDSDRDEIVEEMIKYISCNNTYEYQLLHPGHQFVHVQSPIPYQIMRNSVVQTFQDNLINAGNVLKTQSIFIAKRMPHIRSYLFKAGVNHSFCFFKPSDIVMTEFTVRGVQSGSIEDAMEHVMRVEENLNPFNVFYRLSLIIDNPTPEFVKDMDKLYGVTRKEGRIPDGAMHINLLPTDNEHRRIDEVIRLIHKHF